jgi:hypothetical protein
VTKYLQRTASEAFDIAKEAEKAGHVYTITNDPSGYGLQVEVEDKSTRADK